jgi:dephospho-CoA kinase
LSNWPGKYVIGLTGNIATGKSVVRRMLEHLGAYTIDADALSHRAIARGAPGYNAAVETFGKWIVEPDGEIDRGKLAGLVFNDPAALEKLEAIVHPLVRQAVDVLIKRAGQPVIVVEAIKLLESELRRGCDAIWATYAPEVVQVDRLMRKREMDREQALQRIRVQSPQEGKVAAADVVIRNIGSYDDLWKQVSEAWKKIGPAEAAAPAVSRRPQAGEFSVSRGKPRDSQAIAELINRLSGGRQKITPDDVMAQFGDKAYMLLQIGRRPVGIAGWQVENLVARTTDLYLEAGIDVEKGLEALITQVEQTSNDLQCEASLVFPTGELAAREAIWKKLGYERRTPATLGVQAWTDAASESMPKGSVLFFKQMRLDRVLRPI